MSDPTAALERLDRETAAFRAVVDAVRAVQQQVLRDTLTPLGNARALKVALDEAALTPSEKFVVFGDLAADHGGAGGMIGQVARWRVIILVAVLLYLGQMTSLTLGATAPGGRLELNVPWWILAGTGPLASLSTGLGASTRAAAAANVSCLQCRFLISTLDEYSILVYPCLVTRAEALRGYDRAVDAAYAEMAWTFAELAGMAKEVASRKSGLSEFCFGRRDRVRGSVRCLKARRAG